MLLKHCRPISLNKQRLFQDLPNCINYKTFIKIKNMIIVFPYRTGLSLSNYKIEEFKNSLDRLTRSLRATSVEQFLQHRQILITDRLQQIDILAHCDEQKCSKQCDSFLPHDARVVDF